MITLCQMFQLFFFVSTDFSVSSKNNAGTRYECDCELVITNVIMIKKSFSC